MRRSFYLVYVASFAACAGFAIDAWGSWQAADESRASRPVPERRPSTRLRANGDRSKAGAALADRNMFCSSCDELPPPPPGGELARSALPLDLIATHVTGGAGSFATIRHRESRRVGGYREGDSIPGAGIVERVRGSYVVVLDTVSQRAERIDLVSVATATPAPQVSSSSGVRGDDDFADRIAKLDDTHYEVDRALILAVIADPSKIKGARITLGKQGVKLRAVRGSSLVGKIGLRNGDTITDINGMSATSADKLLEIYAAVKSANNVSITVSRSSVEQTLHYSIR